MSQTSTVPKWVDDFCIQLVLMMREFGVSNPAEILEMPYASYDEVWLRWMEIKKAEKEMAESESKRKKGMGFDG